MGFESNFEMFTSGEREIFMRACRRLESQTYIVKEKDEDNRKLYAFVAKNEDIISSYLGYMGYDIVVDRDNGIISLRNGGQLNESDRIQANRAKLTKTETVILCCLWTIYLDRIRKGISRSVIITMLDLRQELEKYNFKDIFDGKTMMKAILRRLSKFNLIEVSGKIGDPECKIKIFASIQMALDTNEFQRYVEASKNRIMSVKPDDLSVEDEEEAEEVEEVYGE